MIHTGARDAGLFPLDVWREVENEGVGTVLMAAAESAAIRTNLEEVNLEVSVANAIRLYVRRGYRRLPEPVADPWDEIDDQGNRRSVEPLSRIVFKEIVGA